MPGLYKPLDEKTYHDGFITYFRLVNEFETIREKDGDKEAYDQFKVSKISLISELAKEASKAPGRKFDDNFNEILKPMDDESRSVIHNLEKYVFNKTSWNADIPKKR